MKSKKLVKVFWYPAEEHGRRSPPPGPKDFGVYKPKSLPKSDENWSVLLEFLSTTDHRYCRDAMLSFVSDAAPIEALHPGHAFFIFEGRWPVAEGVVLDPTDA